MTENAIESRIVAVPAEPDVDLGDLPVPILEAMYREMVRARRASTRMVNLQRQGRLGAVSQIDGQEGAVVGSMLAMDAATDWIVPSYRERVALKSYPADRMFPVSIALGTQVPQAVGLAWGLKLQRRPGCVLVYFGDGASSQGDFYEAGNLAGVVEAPVVMFCINNGWALSTPVRKQTAAATFAQKAAAFGIPGERVDGNDAAAVYRATFAARARAADGGGPTLIEAVTYRMGGHTTADDPTRYVPESDLVAWADRDPIDRLRVALTASGIGCAALEAKGREAAEADIDQLLAVAANPPDPRTLLDHVFRTPTQRLTRQHTELRHILEQA